MPAIDPDDLPEKISSPPPSHLPIPTKVSHVWMSFSGTPPLGGPVIIPPPSLAVKATLFLLRSLMRERTRMITDLWQKRKNLLCPWIRGDRASGGLGPSGAIVAEPESDHQLRRGSQY